MTRASAGIVLLEDLALAQEDEASADPGVAVCQVEMARRVAVRQVVGDLERDARRIADPGLFQKLRGGAANAGEHDMVKWNGDGAFALVDLPDDARHHMGRRGDANRLGQLDQDLDPILAPWALGLCLWGVEDEPVTDERDINPVDRLCRAAGEVGENLSFGIDGHAGGDGGLPVHRPDEANGAQPTCLPVGEPGGMDLRAFRLACLRIVVGAVDGDDDIAAGSPGAAPGVDRLLVALGHRTDGLEAVLCVSLGDGAVDGHIGIVAVEPGNVDAVGPRDPELSVLDPVNDDLPAIVREAMAWRDRQEWQGQEEEEYDDFAAHDGFPMSRRVLLPEAEGLILPALAGARQRWALFRILPPPRESLSLSQRGPGRLSP